MTSYATVKLLLANELGPLFRFASHLQLACISLCLCTIVPMHCYAYVPLYQCLMAC